jgi:ParB-like chromosome segregation protein Spo0J
MEVVKQEYKARYPVDQIREHEENPNQGDDEAVAGLIDANGFYGACVVQKSTGRILVGNTRYRSALSRGAKVIPVLLVDVDDDHAASIMAGDNRGRDMSRGYDTAKLADLLEGLSATRGLAGTGFGDSDLASLVASLTEPTAPAEFPNIDPDNVHVQYHCPSCGYEWSGKPAPGQG